MAHSPKRPPKSLLRIARELEGWTQNDLAMRLGTAQSRISEWERGKPPGPYFSSKLAEIFGKSIQELGLHPEDREESDEASEIATEHVEATVSEKQSSPLPSV